jgi:hypothetical protein
MINQEQFQKAVILSGSRETSLSPEGWNEENPTFGHCAIVALLAQDVFGGELLRASLVDTEFASSRSHYWNLLPDGSEVDFTEAQFDGRKPHLVGEVRTREYVLTNELTRQRYELLKTLFLENLTKTNSSALR